MKEEVFITIDGKKIKAAAGSSVLKAALDNDIYIPNLCYVEKLEQPVASCRLCFVEIEGNPKPVTSCTEPVREGLVVYTDTEKVRRLQRTAAELLISRHHVDCGKCERNKNCELQNIARFLKVKLKGGRFRKLEKDMPYDESHPCLVYNPNKCVLCGRCVYICKIQGASSFNFAFRGARTVINASCKSSVVDPACSTFGECARVCPVAALTLRDMPKRSTQE